MFVFDRLLVALATKILDAAEAERPTAEAVRAELRELHQRLAAGAIAEAEFDREEARLLDALEEIEDGGAS